MENEPAPQVEVTVTPPAPAPEPESAPAPQVVALETAGVAEIAREQGAQGVTLEEACQRIDQMEPELRALREQVAALQAARVEEEAAPTEVELEPELEEEEAAVEVDVTPASELPTPSESESAAPVPRRERGLFARMFLGKSPSAP